jgi:hypothetical protein
MGLLIAGVLEGAIIGGIAGAVVGLLLGVVMLFIPTRPCAACGVMLPKTLAGPARVCPKCGCRMNAKGEKIEEPPGRG